MSKTPGVKELKAEISLLNQIFDTVGSTSNVSMLLQQIARILATGMNMDSCLIYLMDGSGALTLSGTCPPHPYQVGKLRLEAGEGLTGWVAAHRKTLVIPRRAYMDPRFKLFQNLPEDKYEAFISVPILLKDELIGVINLQHRRSKTLTAERLKLLSNIARQIAGAIEKTRLIQQATIKARQLETITQLSNSIVSNAYLHEILQLIVTMTAQTMNSKICSLMLFDEKTQELRIAATQSLSEDYRKKPPLKVGQSVSGSALKIRKPVAVADVTCEPGYMYPKIARQEGLRSMLAVPMLFKNTPIGVVNCYTTSEHVFSEEEIDILQTIANQAAVAIENTRLLEEARSAKEALETRKIIERAKGILMRGKNMDEEGAFQFIQHQAMDLRRTMREIAEAIILTEGIKKA